MAVFRAEGKKPSILDAADIERLRSFWFSKNRSRPLAALSTRTEKKIPIGIFLSPLVRPPKPNFLAARELFSCSLRLNAR
jgi:hypothetical protein